MTGGAVTVIFALDVFPVPPSVEVTCTLLFFTPAAVLCTLGEPVHDALAASVPADKLAVPEPASAVAVPPQVLVRLFGVATASPAGKLSVKPKPVSGTPVFGLFMLNVSDVVPVRGIVAAPNALVIAGGLATVRFAEAVFPVPPFVELTAPLTFVYWPDAVPVTFTSTVQEVFRCEPPPRPAIPRPPRHCRRRPATRIGKSIRRCHHQANGQRIRERHTGLRHGVGSRIGNREGERGCPIPRNRRRAKRFGDRGRCDHIETSRSRSARAAFRRSDRARHVILLSCRSARHVHRKIARTAGG